jgi:hypothetical protein
MYCQMNQRTKTTYELWLESMIEFNAKFHVNQGGAHDTGAEKVRAPISTPCPRCGDTIHADLVCGDGRVVKYCAAWKLSTNQPKN